MKATPVIPTLGDEGKEIASPWSSLATELEASLGYVRPVSDKGSRLWTTRLAALSQLCCSPRPSHERLTCVGAVVDLEVFQAGEALAAGGAAVRLLVGVSPDMDEHLVPAPERTRGHTQLGRYLALPPCPHPAPSPGIEATAMAGTALPMTAVSSILFRLDMMVIDMVNQVLEELKELVTLWGQAGF